MNFFKMCCGIPIRINDSVKGEKTVVLLHGYLETADVWETFTNTIKNFCRVISFDLPGNGLSGSHQSVNSMEFMADVTAEVMKACGVSEAVIVGHSMGGYTALAFAKKHPEMVHKLCLFHSTPKPDTEEKKTARDREIELIQAGKLSLIVEYSIDKMFATENIKPLADVIDEIKENAEISDACGIIACLRGMKERDDMNDFLASFKKPTALILGLKDNHISKEVAESLIAKFTNCEHLLLENSGHAGFLEEPEKSAEFLKYFIEK